MTGWCGTWAPGLSAQGAHRPPRAAPYHQAGRWPGAVSARTESEYDTFGVGHSSTRSAPHWAWHRRAKRGEDRRAVAIIGDGALTAGMAFEALNHAGTAPADLLIILNDNDMSISENVGALSNYLARALSGRMYSHLREGGRRCCADATVWELARRSEEHLKGMVLQARCSKRWVQLHRTGGWPRCQSADRHPQQRKEAAWPPVPACRDAQGQRLCAGGSGSDQMAWPGRSTGERQDFQGSQHRPDVFADLRPVAVRHGRARSEHHRHHARDARRLGSGRVLEALPDRYYDVAIAEQHAVTFAAGLACEGFKPIVAIYSTFLQRAYDQLIHDVALQNLPVVFALDRAGLVGSDGATHQGSYDLSFLRCIRTW